MEDKPRRRAHDLTSGPIARSLLVFALPVLGSNVLQSLNGSVNAVWVGRFLGESALTATSNANLVLFLLLGTVFGIGMAATIMVAQSVGAHDMHEARRIVGTSASFFFAVSALFAICGWIWVDDILNLLGTPPDALPLAHAYLRIIFVAVPAMNLLAFVMTVLRGAGDSRTPFFFMALAVVLDIILNPLLIRGIGPFPELGIAGSAASTLIGQTVSVVAIIALLYARRHPLRLAGADLALLRPAPGLGPDMAPVAGRLFGRTDAAEQPVKGPEARRRRSVRNGDAQRHRTAGNEEFRFRKDPHGNDRSYLPSRILSYQIKTPPIALFLQQLPIFCTKLRISDCHCLTVAA